MYSHIRVTRAVRLRRAMACLNKGWNAMVFSAKAKAANPACAFTTPTRPLRRRPGIGMVIIIIPGRA